MSHNIHHKAATRGHADLGWLDSWHSFSFADYYNPERVQFGVLRVLNDDRVQGGKGFGLHPHDNMEIISIPLEGSLVHEDNMGHRQVVGKGEIQVMSTGSGVFHSEYNNSQTSPAEFLQIWVFPNRLNVTPRYDQVRINPSNEHNSLQQIVSPFPGAGKSNDGRNASGEGSWIYQDAWFHMGAFDAGREFTYDRKKAGNGIYLFIIAGVFLLDGHRLERRDGLGITGADSLKLKAVEQGSRILIMDVAMENKLQ
jgi:redox-sensitive bicupin YhaK (pirin superfamily)